MPNPVAVNDLSPISGSLQTSRVSYGVETAGKNYGQNYNSTNWYSDIPNNGQFYTIISDNYTANYYVSRSNAGGAYVEGGLPAVDDYSAPVFWITQGTSSLDVITIVNGLPDRIGQIPFNSGSQALNWVASSSNYFAVGPDYYDQIDADQMLFYVNASQVISYPTTQSTWYDLSGNSSNVSLQNTPSWDSNGWFSGDGTDDTFVVSPTAINYSRTALTVEAFIYYNASYSGYKGAIMSKWQTGAGSNNEWSFSSDNTASAGAGPGNLGLVLQYTSAGIQVVYGTTVMVPQKWYHCVATYDGSNIRIYTNGKLETTTAAYANSYKEYSTQPTALLGFGNGLVGGPDYYPTNARLSEARIYNKAISTSEVAQNYYGGPVVTGSISGSYQAGNLVSYVTGSTATYNMAANIVSGSLQNGVSYSPTNGGYWSFDGSDDRILLEGSTTNAWTLPTSIDWTVTAWIRTTTTANGLGQGSIFSNSNGGPVYSMLGINAGVITYWYYFSSWVKSNGTIPVNDGNWHMLTWVNFAGGTMNLYVDGGIDTAGVNSNTSSGNALDIIGASWTGYFQGDIASLQINKGKAFTADEVLQQYNATK
jgi:hypothetical protein